MPLENSGYSRATSYIVIKTVNGFPTTYVYSLLDAIGGNLEITIEELVVISLADYVVRINNVKAFAQLEQNNEYVSVNNNYRLETACCGVPMSTSREFYGAYHYDCELIDDGFGKPKTGITGNYHTGYNRVYSITITITEFKITAERYTYNFYDEDFTHSEYNISSPYDLTHDGVLMMETSAYANLFADFVDYLNNKVELTGFDFARDIGYDREIISVDSNCSVTVEYDISCDTNCEVIDIITTTTTTLAPTTTTTTTLAPTTTTTTTLAPTTTTTTTIIPTTTTTTTISPDGYVLLAQFNTNSGSATTFDPSITSSSGDYKWDLGNGVIVTGNNVTYTYADSTIKTVSLYGKGTCNITGVDFNADNIVGNLKIDNPAFSTIDLINLDGNSSLTGATFNNTITSSLISIVMRSCNLIGIIDLSMFTTLYSGCSIMLNNNSNLTGIRFANSISGEIGMIIINNTGIIGNLDLSMFTSFNTSAIIWLYNNSNLTGVTFANTVTGIIDSIDIRNSGIIGNLNLSMFNTFSNGNVRLSDNYSLTGVTFANSISGSIGVLDMSYCNLIGILDLSMFTTFNGLANIKLQWNFNMTGVTFAGSTTGNIALLDIDSSSSLGYVNLSGLHNDVDSSNFVLAGNGWTTAIVNHILTDLDSISSFGFTGRIINISGNSAPDASSGGYNGTAAKSSLQGKGFTVNTD